MRYRRRIDARVSAVHGVLLCVVAIHCGIYVGRYYSDGSLLNQLNTVGASGAVYGILLAFGMLFPNSEMFVFPIPMPIKAKYFVIGYAVIELLLGITGGDGVAHFAHLGGMLVGFILIIYWRKKNGGRQQFYY